MTDPERLARRAAGGDLGAAMRLVELLKRRMVAGDQEALAASAKSKLTDGDVGSVMIDELVVLRVVDPGMADLALNRLAGKPSYSATFDGSNEFRPAVCPSCGGVPRGEVNTMEGIAEFEEGRFEYAGWTDHDWSTQRGLVGPNGGCVVACREGHRWEVFPVRLGGT